MSDTYKELLVKKTKNTGGNIAKVVCMVLTIVCVLLGLFYNILLIPAILFGVLTYFVSLHSNLEYEYLYLDKELTVDKIMAQTKRKTANVFSLEKMEILAPEGSYRLDEFKNKNYKVLDYSGEGAFEKTESYVMYYSGECKVCLSLTPEFVSAVYTGAPRKVFTK